jgi:hypothetical protein
MNRLAIPVLFLRAMIVHMYVLLALFFYCSISCAEEAAEIPLSDIWAYEMPGTKDVRKLEPEVYGDEAKSLPPQLRDELHRNSIIQNILNSLYIQPNPELGLKALRKPKQGFVVEGREKRALREASAVLGGDKQAKKSFLLDSDHTLVFYSLDSGVFVHVVSAEIHGNQIEIHFRFVPHLTDISSSHFALIPLPKLSIGRYRVAMIEDSVEQKYWSWGIDKLNPKLQSKYICKDFEFKVG